MKTIPLEEAKKLATPRKVRVNRDKDRENGLDEVVYDDEQGRECFVALVHVRSPKTLAPLIAHSMNIRDDLIEALERVVILGPSKEGLGGHAPISAFIDEAFRIRMLLERVKKVEMP